MVEMWNSVTGRTNEIRRTCQKQYTVSFSATNNEELVYNVWNVSVKLLHILLLRTTNVLLRWIIACIERWAQLYQQNPIRQGNQCIQHGARCTNTPMTTLHAAKNGLISKTLRLHAAAWLILILTDADWLPAMCSSAEQPAWGTDSFLDADWNRYIKYFQVNSNQDYAPSCTHFQSQKVWGELGCPPLSSSAHNSGSSDLFRQRWEHMRINNINNN